MDRYNFEEHISAYIDGELSELDEKQIKNIVYAHAGKVIHYPIVITIIEYLMMKMGQILNH